MQAQYKVDPDYLVNHTTVNSKIRTILIDWLLQVHYKFELEQETLFLTVSIIDRYMELVSTQYSIGIPYITHLHCIVTCT